MKQSRVELAYSTVGVARFSFFLWECSAAEELPKVLGSNVGKCEATAWWLLVFILLSQTHSKAFSQAIPTLIGKKNNFEAHFESGNTRNSVSNTCEHMGNPLTVS